MRPYYASYLIHGTDTGRISGDFMQVPRVNPDLPNLRNCVAAPDGLYLLESDYSMLELRLIAWRAREETMLRLLREGKDIHAHSGRTLFGVPEGQSLPPLARPVGKTANFGLGYEAGPPKLAEIMLLGMTDEDIGRVTQAFRVASLADAAAIIHATWHEMYPGVRRWHAEEKRRIIANKGVSIAPQGREKRVPLIFSHDQKERAEAFRDGINHVIQSPATDLLHLSAILANERMYADYGVVAGPWPFHDAVLYLMKPDRVADAVAYLREVMTKEAVAEFHSAFGVDIDVPLDVDFKGGVRWGALKQVVLEQPVKQ